MKPYIFFLLSIILFSCNKTSNTVMTKAETEADIIQYIEDNNLTAQKSNSGLYYVITEQGNGDAPNSNSNVTVSYKGYFLDGSVFDQSNAAGITFNLQQVIKGWTECITYFNEGGEGILLVPSQLGYGSN